MEQNATVAIRPAVRLHSPTRRNGDGRTASVDRTLALENRKISDPQYWRSHQHCLTEQKSSILFLLLFPFPNVRNRGARGHQRGRAVPLAHPPNPSSPRLISSHHKRQ